MRSPTFGYTLFCDDVRREVGGKLSFMGVYGGAMQVSQLPTHIAKLFAVSTYTQSIEEALPSKLTLKIFRSTEKDEDDELMFENDIPINRERSPPPDAVVFRTRVISQMAGLHISEPCTIRVRFYRDDIEVRAGVLTIKLSNLQKPTA